MAMVERRCMVGGVKGEGGDGDGPCMAANGRLGVVEKKTYRSWCTVLYRKHKNIGDLENTEFIGIN